MRNSLLVSAILFCALVALGAWVCDTLIQLTLPGDPCYGLFLGITVAVFSVVFLLSMGYLGVLVMRVVEDRWVPGFPRHGIAHAVGCATLFFTSMSPFVVLHGPKASTSYGERVAVIEALQQSVAAQKAVEQFWRAHERFPINISEARVRERPDTLATVIQSITLGDGGVITLSLATHRYPSVDKKTLVLIPTTNAGSVDWDCRGGNLPDHVRPAECRRESACKVLSASRPY